MKKFRASLSQPSTKAPTGTVELHEHLRGGRARERITLLAGGPVCGKSVLALQAFAEAMCQRGVGRSWAVFKPPSQSPIMSNAESTPILKPETPWPGAREIRHFEPICS